MPGIHSLFTTGYGPCPSPIEPLSLLQRVTSHSLCLSLYSPTPSHISKKIPLIGPPLPCVSGRPCWPCTTGATLIEPKHAVTDSLAYFILSFLFRFLVPLLSVNLGRFAHQLHNLSMDRPCVFQRFPYVTIRFRLVPSRSVSFRLVPLPSSSFSRLGI